jgi:hypothetical protein
MASACNANIYHKLNNFAVGMATSPFISKTQFGAFIFFGVITLIGAVWVYFFVPETKGRTLEEMDELFGVTGMAAADGDRKRRIEREIGLLALLGEDSGVDESKTASDDAIDSANKHVEATDLPNEKA